MTLIVRRSTPRALDPMEVVVLGEVRGRRYVTHEGREYQMDPSPMSEFEVHEAIPDDQIRIKRDETLIEEDGHQHRTTVLWRGREVPPGTFRGLVEQDQALEGKKQARRRSRPVDLLDRLGYQPDLIVGAGRPAGGYSPPKPSIRGPRAILDWLEARGTRLSLTADGRLYAEMRPGAHVRLLPTIRLAERLLAAELRGEPLPCELPGHEEPAPAVTIVAVDVAACEAHVRGDLP
jgi:hypothetical protein